MNVSPVNYNTTSVNLYNKRAANNNNMTVSFCGKSEIVQSVSEKGGCILRGVGLVLAIPFLLISLLFDYKKNYINNLINSIQNEYFESEEMYTNITIEEINKLLDKHSKNDDYTRFVKKALTFILFNIENSTDIDDRLEPFKSNDNINELNTKTEFFKFMQTINLSAQAAISKNLKNIDTEKLDKDIKSAREIMERTNNINV